MLHNPIIIRLQQTTTSPFIFIPDMPLYKLMTIINHPDRLLVTPLHSIFTTITPFIPSHVTSIDCHSTSLSTNYLNQSFQAYTILRPIDIRTIYGQQILHVTHRLLTHGYFMERTTHPQLYMILLITNTIEFQSHRPTSTFLQSDFISILY